MNSRRSSEDPPIHVLYVHHAGSFGGASRSLLELIRGFAPGTVAPRLVTQRGSVSRVFRQSGIEILESAGISQFDHTRFGHYRGKRWLYRNPAAKTAGGLYRVQIAPRKDVNEGYRVDVYAYGDLSAATDPGIATFIVVGNDPFFDTSTWNQRKDGWVVDFQP